MKLNNFAGGQSSRVRPQFLALNEGVVYDNIDMSVGSLQAVKDKLASAITTPKFSILFEGNWVGSAILYEDWYLKSTEILMTSFE